MDAQPTDLGTILMICTANICRSPLAGLHLRELLDGGPFARVVVESAGVRGLDGAPMCEVAAAALDWPEAATSHAARAMTRQLVESADLVIAMEKDQRGAVARLAPGHQGRIFTLREAVAMVEAIRATDDVPLTVPALTERMRALRGIVRPPVPEAPEPRRRFLFFRRTAPEVADDGLSVEDGHNIDPAEHQRTVDEVRGLVDRLAVALTSPTSSH